MKKQSQNLTTQNHEDLIKLNRKISDINNNQIVESKESKITTDNKVDTEIKDNTELSDADGTSDKKHNE